MESIWLGLVFRSIFHWLSALLEKLYPLHSGKFPFERSVRYLNVAYLWISLYQSTKTIWWMKMSSHEFHHSIDRKQRVAHLLKQNWKRNCEKCYHHRPSHQKRNQVFNFIGNNFLYVAITLEAGARLQALWNWLESFARRWWLVLLHVWTHITSHIIEWVAFMQPVNRNKVSWRCYSIIKRNTLTGKTTQMGGWKRCRAKKFLC